MPTFADFAKLSLAMADKATNSFLEINTTVMSLAAMEPIKEYIRQIDYGR